MSQINLSPVVNYLVRNHTFSNDYCMTVLFEYKRFMSLKSQYPFMSPSDNIDKFWHAHLLYTQLYYDYCMTNFHRLIHHDPDMAIDQKARQVRITNTLKQYEKDYGKPRYPEVWGLTNDKITISILYTFDVANGIRKPD